MFNKTFPINEKGRDFVVGDLHGCYDQLQIFRDFIRFDNDKDRMFSVGDLIDRGSRSFDCLKLIDTNWFHAVRGNHEDLMINALLYNGSLENWIYNGGAWMWECDPTMLNAYSHKLNTLPLVINVQMPKNKVFHVIHAEIRGTFITDEHLMTPGLVDFMQYDGPMFEDPSLTWGRQLFGRIYDIDLTLENREDHRRYLELSKRLERFGVPLGDIFCGHTPVRNPTAIACQINLDTGAFATGEHPWYGLTFAEPLTGKFWKVTDDVDEVELVEI
jgi:hypothetical protein